MGGVAAEQQSHPFGRPARISLSPSLPLRLKQRQTCRLRSTSETWIHSEAVSTSTLHIEGPGFAPQWSHVSTVYNYATLNKSCLSEEKQGGAWLALRWETT